MKQNKNNVLGSSLIVTVQVQRWLKRLNGAFARKGGRGLISILLRVLQLVPIRSSRSWALAIYLFSKRVNHIANRNGMPYLVRYLKAVAVLLQQSRGGHIHPASQDLGLAVSRTRRGIPRIIPRAHRTLILTDRRYMIAWLSIANIYRVLVIPGKLKLSTITDPGKMLSGTLIIGMRNFIEEKFWPMLHARFSTEMTAAAQEVTVKGKPKLVTTWATKSLSPKYFPINKSGSASNSSDRDGETSTSIRAMCLQAKAWLADPVMWSHFCEWVKLIGPMPSTRAANAGPALRFAVDPVPVAFRKDLEALAAQALVSHSSDKQPVLGRLSVKEEAAGKMRVFAIVDCWTQWMLHPLHSAIMNILRRIPQDGTFDQTAPIKRLQLRKNSYVACYDLSAATDRLPLQIQKMLLQRPLGLHLSEVWGSLLTARTYWFGAKKPIPIKYAVGQPMGALSSWAMLALTHHMIVQYAATKAKKVGWFTGYAILGDDIIITDESVAVQYLQLMDELGVGIGLAKSLVSRKGIAEFAKRFYVPEDASPISMKEVAVALNDTSTLIALAHKRSKASIANIIAFLGYGYKVRGNLNKRYSALPIRVRNWLLMLTHPDGPHPVGSYDAWVLTLGPHRSAKTELQSVYASLNGVLVERLNARLKGLAPAIARAWDLAMLPRRIKSDPKSIPKWMTDNPAWLFMSKKVWASQQDIAWEVSLIRKELKRIATLHDTREAFLAALKVEESIALMQLPKDLETRTRVESRFRWPVLVDQWVRARHAASKKNKAKKS